MLAQRKTLGSRRKGKTEGDAGGRGDEDGGNGNVGDEAMGGGARVRRRTRRVRHDAGETEIKGDGSGVEA